MPANNVIISAPMSYAGSSQRIWKLTRLGTAPLKAVTIPLALLLVLAAWTAVTGWYLVFGILLWPYRLVRRGQRKDRRAELRHQELLEATYRSNSR